jgi:hypothetical protein
MGNAGAGRPKFKKPTLKSFVDSLNSAHEKQRFSSLDDALMAVMREKGRREAQIIFDSFGIKRLTDLPDKHFSSFLQMCRNTLKN